MVEKKNAFNPEEIERVKQEQIVRDKDAKDRLERTIALGKKCLANPDFRQYRDEYEKLEQAIVESWINLVEPDPFKYTVRAQGMALKLHQVRLLLHGVKKAAGDKE